MTMTKNLSVPETRSELVAACDNFCKSSAAGSKAGRFNRCSYTWLTGTDAKRRGYLSKPGVLLEDRNQAARA